MKFNNLEELNACEELFVDNERLEKENRAPFIQVIDNFYPDPEAIRTLALEQSFHQYSPPLAAQVGEDVANQFSSNHPLWLSTSVQIYHGKPVAHPVTSFRHATESLRDKLANVIGEPIDTQTWDTLGDGWNGAFHLQYDSEIKQNWIIHHHFKEYDVFPYGWSGVVYLTPNAPENSGTSIWLDKSTGRCTASKGGIFAKDSTPFEHLLTIPNKFNRLVLCRENVLHRAEPAFGSDPESGRLTQTFFFRSRP